jgi:DNA polymerase-3 subunit gamma/tau
LPTQALYLKWRPRTFDDVIGQEHITRTLRNAIVQNRMRHAYLFNGPRGTGKTTMARILAKAVNCLHSDPALRPCDECKNCAAVMENRFLDLIEIDAASNNSVDDVRDLREKVQFSPSEGRYKVYIIDEVHRFSGAAFDALLKTLEEPPDHAIFVLATTELDKVPATIKSRSLMFEFRRVSLSEVADRLQLIISGEGIKAERAALELVARTGTGSVRDSISLLDQLIVDPNEPITLAKAEAMLGTAGARAVSGLVGALIDNNPATGLDLLNQAIDQGADPAQFARQIVEYLRNLLLVQMGGPSLVDVSSEMRETLQAQGRRIGRAALIRAIRAFNGAAGEIRGGWQPQLPLELALIESTRPIQEEVVMVRSAETGSGRQPAAAAPNAAEPEAEDFTPTDESTATLLARMKSEWPNLVQVLRGDAPTRTVGAMLVHTSVKSLDGETLILSLSDTVAPTFKDKIETEDKRKIIVSAVRRAFRANIKNIRVVISKVNDKMLTNDPVLNMARDELGGSIESVSDADNL